jgi:hypothetical protein
LIDLLTKPTQSRKIRLGDWIAHKPNLPKGGCDASPAATVFKDHFLSKVEKFGTKENRIITIAVGVSLALGVALTGYGLRRLNFSVRPDHAVFVALAWGLVWLGGRFGRKSPYVIAGGWALFIALASGALWPLVVTLWFGLAATLLGRSLLRKLGVRGSRSISNFLVGAGIYGTGIGLLAHWPLSYPLSYGVALALPLLLGRKILPHWYRVGKRGFADARLAAEMLSHWLDVSLAAMALLYFVVALMPEMGYDALWIHLFVPAHIAARHEWGFDVTTYVWAVIPMMGDWLFSLGYMLGGESAARLINVGFALVLAGQVREWALWVGSTTQGAKWATLLFLTTSLTFTVGSTLFIESVLASFVLAGALALCRACFDRVRQNTQWMLAGLLLGCALAAKATTLTFFPALAIVLLWRYQTWWQMHRLRILALASSALVLLGMIPYATAWWLTGNPVFPFFNKVFRSPFWYSLNFEQSAFGKGATWDLLYKAMFHSDRYFEGRPGTAGFQWLALFLPLIVFVVVARRWRGVVIIWLGVVTTVLAFRSTAYLRYVFPSMALLTAALGLVMTWGQRLGGVKRHAVTFTAVSVVFLNLIFLNAGSFYGDFPWRTLLSENDRRHYIAQTLPMRTAVNMVNQLNISEAPVLVVGTPRTAGLVADALYADWTNYPLEAVWPALQNEAEAARLLKERNVTYALVDANSPLSTKTFISLVSKICDPLATFGSVSVLKLKKEYHYQQELLLNTTPSSGEHWSLAGSARFDAVAGALITNVNEPATQVVKVEAGRTYLYALEAKCHQEKTLVRLQVNWSDAQGRFISADLQPFDCTDNWERHQMEVVPPVNAAQAIVYVTSHTATPAAFRSISFR